jgi:hypothetical protein
MRAHIATFSLLAATVLCTPLLAHADLPSRNFTVQLREVADPQAVSPGYVVRTQSSEPSFPPQQVRVRNGEKAHLHMVQTRYVQWVQSAQAPGSGAGSNGGGIAYAVTPLQAGQSLSVTPRWPGGKKAVTLDIAVHSDSVSTDSAGSAWPTTQRVTVLTSVAAPLGEWVTIATTASEGSAGNTQPLQAGTYRSDNSSAAPRVLQVRVQ